MAGLNPSNAVCHDQPIGDGDIKVPRAKPLVPDSKSVCVKAKHRKKNAVGAGNSECFWPILPGETIGLARVVQPVETDIEMIEQGRTDGFVPSKTEVVGESRLEKVRVEGRREGLGSVKLFLVATAIGEEEFIAIAPVLVNPETHGGVQNGVIGDKDEIISQPLCGVRMNGKVGKHLLSNRTERNIDLVSGECEAASDEASGTRGSRGIKDLSPQYRRIVARID